MAEPPAPDVPPAVAAVFEDALGTTKTTRGADLRVDLQLTFDEAVEGDIAGKDCLVRFKRQGRTLAVASIFRDAESLQAEIEMELRSV